MYGPLYVRMYGPLNHSNVRLNFTVLLKAWQVLGFGQRDWESLRNDMTNQLDLISSSRRRKRRKKGEKEEL